MEPVPKNSIVQIMHIAFFSNHQVFLDSKDRGTGDWSFHKEINDLSLRSFWKNNLTKEMKTGDFEGIWLKNLVFYWDSEKKGVSLQNIN